MVRHALRPLSVVILAASTQGCALGAPGSTARFRLVGSDRAGGR